MDELENMIASVRDVVEVDRASAWFKAVTTAYEEGAAGWSAFKESLATAAGDVSSGDQAVEAFVKYGDTLIDPMGVVGKMHERKSDLPGLYASLVAPEKKPEEELDESAAEWDAETAAEWYEFFTTSNDWAGWTGGGEAQWAEFKQWFLYYAELQEAKEPAAKFLERVEGDSGGYAAGLAVYGIHTEVAALVPVPVPEAPSGWGTATAERYEQLTAGKGWGGWSGVEDDWGQFTQWFLYYAAEDGDEEKARAFVAEAEAGNKVTVFAGHGITLAPPVAVTGPIEVSVAEVQSVADRVLEERPELAEIPEARRRELMEEVRRELAESR